MPTQRGLGKGLGALLGESALSEPSTDGAVRLPLQKVEPNPLLLLDEPFSALDYQTRLRAADEIFGIIRKEHKTAILVTHDIAEAISMSDRILVFSDRPAHLKAEHVVALTSPDTPLQRRNAPEFSGLFNTLWKELEHHGV